MKSKWRVSSNPIGGQTYYQIFRIRDTNQVDHSGNRELYGGLETDRELAQSIAKALNEEAEAEALIGGRNAYITNKEEMV